MHALRMLLSLIVPLTATLQKLKLPSLPTRLQHWFFGLHAPHHASPKLQQWPFVQMFGHVTPHPPQLFLSTDVSTHLLLQRVVPPKQPILHEGAPPSPGGVQK